MGRQVPSDLIASSRNQVRAPRAVLVVSGQFECVAVRGDEKVGILDLPGEVVIGSTPG
jgi:hypothetical protein